MREPSFSPGTGPPDWLRLTVGAPPGAEPHSIADALRAVGCRAIERGTDSVIGFLPGSGHHGDLVADLRAHLRAATSLVDPAIQVERVEGTAWQDRQGGNLRPKRVSKRLVVAPVVPHRVTRSDPGVARTDPPSAQTPGAPFLASTASTSDEEAAAGGGTYVLRLHPGPAFGSAEHGSTRAALHLLDGAIEKEDRVLDVGTGSGVLAIAAALLGAGHVIAVERDPIAAAAAEAHARLNRVEDRVHVRNEEARPGAVAATAPGTQDIPFHGALANLEAELLLPLLPDLVASLRTLGWLIVSGLHRGEGDALVAEARSQGLEILDVRVDDGWWAGLFRRTR